MALFKLQNNKVTKIHGIDFGLEKEMQKVFEDNLYELLNIHFLAHEYSTSWDSRIDTLGIDNNGAPVILEYKKGYNNQVMIQALSYLKWLLDHKSEFENLVKEKNIDIEIDWNSPRIICVAESFNRRDLDASEFISVNLELYKYQAYKDGILSLDSDVQYRLKNTRNSIKQVRNVSFINKDEIDYSVDFHLEKTEPELKKIFLELQKRIMALDESIIEEAKAKYIAYKLITNFVDITILVNSLKLTINIKSGELQDPYNLARDMVNPVKIGKWGNGDYQIKVEKDTDLDKVMELIKQSFNYNR